jgi:hypothetical protein
MKLYLVSSGSYSDYQVHSIWSTPEKAEEIRKIVSHANDVEVFNLDSVPDMKDDSYGWYFTFAPNGDLLKTEVNRYGWDEVYEEDGNLVIQVSIAEFDQAKAFKIATDNRARYLAEKKGLA